VRVGRTRVVQSARHKKLLALADRMYTDAGRALAVDRRAYVESFLERFDAEVAGER